MAPQGDRGVPKGVEHRGEAAQEVWRECVRYGFCHTAPAAPSQANFSRKSICLRAKEENLMDYPSYPRDGPAGSNGHTRVHCE